MIFSDVLSASQMFSAVFQSTWRDNGTRGVLGRDYTSCFPSEAFFKKKKIPRKNHCPSVGTLKVYWNGAAHPQ